MSIEYGHPFYGQKLAVLVFSTKTPRIAGDPGNNDSFEFPVRYEVIKGGFKDLLEYNNKVENTLNAVMKKLVEDGIKGVVADCGLMSMYQNVLGKWGIPFVGSTLVTIPSLWNIIGRDGSIGILTGHSKLLTKEHLENSGITSDINVSIQGLENEPHFKEIVIEGHTNLDVDFMEKDVLNAVKKLMKKTNNLRAIVIECSNLGTYSKIIESETGVPVIDIVSTANFLKNIIDPKKF